MEGLYRYEVWNVYFILYMLYLHLEYLDEMSRIYFKKGVVFSEFLQEKPGPVFLQGEKMHQLKTSFPIPILFLVKIHDSSFLEILQWYHKVYFLHALSSFNLSNTQGIQFSVFWFLMQQCFIVHWTRNKASVKQLFSQWQN